MQQHKFIFSQLLLLNAATCCYMLLHFTIATATVYYFMRFCIDLPVLQWLIVNLDWCHIHVPWDFDIKDYR